MTLSFDKKLVIGLICITGVALFFITGGLWTVVQTFTYSQCIPAVVALSSKSNVALHIYPLFTVRADKSTYPSGSSVEISGQVCNQPVRNDTVRLQVYDPYGKIYKSSLTCISWDYTGTSGAYSYEFSFDNSSTIGDYYVTASYYGNEKSGTLITYLKSNPNLLPSAIYDIKSASKSWPVSYAITSGSNMTGMFLERGTPLFHVGFNSESDGGQITIVLPRSLIDSKEGNNDKNFFVSIISGGGGALLTQDAHFQEISSSDQNRTLVIALEKGSHAIWIYGTKEAS